MFKKGILTLISLSLAGCMTAPTLIQTEKTVDYSDRIPAEITTKEKVVIVDPIVHVWGAYDAEGLLVKAGQATAGGHQCPDAKGSCSTKVGTFRVSWMKAADCKSSLYPKPHGGGLMPYCMFFNEEGQALHGAPDTAIIDGNISHGCVRMHISDAKWLYENFVKAGTKVIIKPY